MPLPAGVVTRQVEVTVPLDMLGASASALSGHVKPDRALIWGATGEQIWPVPARLPDVVDGKITFSVPIVDQPGMVDSSGAPVTNWTYHAQLTSTWGVARRTISKNFQVYAADVSPIDLDLVPEDGVTEPPVVAPDPYVVSVGGVTGVVTGAQLDPVFAAQLADEGSSTAGAVVDMLESDTAARDALDARFQRKLFLNVRDYGAKGDATTIDDAAFAAWRADLIAFNASGLTTGIAGLIPPGKYRLTSGLNLSDLGISIAVRGDGADQTFLIGDFVGAGQGIIDISNYTGDTYSTKGHRITGIGFLGRGTPGDPIGVKALNSFEHVVDDINAPYGVAWAGNPTGVVLANSVVVDTNDNNSKWDNVRTQGGWQPKAFDTGSATASFTSGSAVVTLSAAVATAAMVGETMFFASGSDTGENAIWSATILSRDSDTQVTLASNAPSTAAGVRFVVGHIKGSINSGSQSLVLSNIVGLSSAYVGMQVHVIGASLKTDASNTAGLLSTTITGVDVATKTLTLAAPATNTVANAVVLFAPGVFLGSFQGDPNTRQTNHSWWGNTHIEGFACAGLIANRILYAAFDNLKLHGAAYSYADDWGQCYYPGVFSEIKTMVIGNVQAAYGIFGTKLHISASRGILSLDGQTELHNMVKDVSPILVTNVTDEFRLVQGDIALVHPISAFSATFLPYQVPKPQHIVAKGIVTHRNKQGTITRTAATVTRGVTGVEGAVALNDDTVLTYTPPGTFGFLHVVADAAGCNAIVFFRTSSHASGALAESRSAGTNIEVLTVGTDLTGTTGTDGKLVIAPDTSGRLRIENRRGFAIRVSLIASPFGT